ncbi:hypothetical protein [Halobacillus mangrovi]|uniref:Uncharacterized protein n=1 Tax=Halobacillus mangrovi TaxID=402384 RepID=A0A1W5ZWT4_9BACI|nr:hypothetical protein [Halobacillus mangrovi]ARI77754.1 hypothetical protein HM131_13245 [Halobacillus mangrovi]
MSDFHLFVILTVVLVASASFLLSMRFQHTLHQGQKMVLAMAQGTTLGFVAGLLIATLFPYQLFLSSIISLIAGSFIGGLCGYKLGMISCLEGVTSGLMSSLMGAMLSAMILPQQSILFIQLFLTLSFCSLLFYPVFTNHSNRIPSKRWFLKPLLILLISSSYLIAGSVLDDTPNPQPIDHHKNQHLS